MGIGMNMPSKGPIGRDRYQARAKLVMGAGKIEERDLQG
jgi:hypothetical protein